MRFLVHKQRIILTPENFAESVLLQSVQLDTINPLHGSSLILSTPELDASAPEVSNQKKELIYGEKK